MDDGSVTFLFTDIEGSTRLWDAAPEAMAAALARHDALLRSAIETNGGHVFKTVGDAFCAVFPNAHAAVAAALEAQDALAREAWPAPVAIRVRMALHAGPAEARDGDYFGATLNRCARLLAAGHGGQVLVSFAARELLSELPDGASLKDLASHRLKDLALPEHVFQLVHPELAADFPPLRSLDRLPNNLPIARSSFVGRERELAEVKRLLGRTRLLTLTGAGGSGKTRLALQAAAEVAEDYSDGVWFVDLAALADGALVPATTATALGLRDEPGRTMVETLAAYLGPRQLVLVLDNCEHLVEACAGLADELLARCPGLRVLATSREPLRVGGEVVLTVPTLSLPDPAVVARAHLDAPSIIERSEAGRLFLERAVATRSDFRLTPANAGTVAEVCRRLDGIPLAIELAAARLHGLTVEQIAGRLSERFRLLSGGSRTALPRQQTLLAALEWSYELLTENERRILQRLGVFAGAIQLEAAEAVCAGDGVEAGDVIGGLLEIVAKSLVIADPWDGAAQYRLLESLREYALARLAESGDGPAARDRHLQWYIELVARMEHEMRGPQQVSWLRGLEREHDNLRAALTWALADASRTPQAVALAGPLFRFWTYRGHLREGHEWLDRARRAALDAHLDEVAPEAVGWVMVGDSAMLGLLSADEVAARAEEARQLFERSGSALGLGLAAFILGAALLSRGDVDRAEALTVESIERLREAGQESDVVVSLNSLGEIARLRGDLTRAAAQFEECLAIAARGPGGMEQAPLMWPLHNLGHIQLRRGEVAGAAERFRDSLRLSRSIGAPLQMGACLAGLAGVAAARSEPERAARLFGAAAAVMERASYVLDNTDQLDWDRNVAIARAQLDDEAWTRAWAEGAAMSADDAVALALNEGSGHDRD